MALLEVHDVLGLAQPATKLIDLIREIVGDIYEPHKIKKLADAHSYQLKTTVDTAKELGFTGEIIVSPESIKIENSSLSKAEVQSLIHSEVKRLFYEKQNICQIADYAYDDLKDDKTEVSLEVDADWMASFFDTSRKICRDDLQFIFGKILAGEIKNPGTYSKRLIGILANLSQKEAEVFEKVSKYVFRDRFNSFIISNKKILDNFDIKLDDILLLEEAGLINSSSLSASKCDAYEYKGYLIDFYGAVPILSVYALTKCGGELERALDQSINVDYLRQIKNLYSIEKMSYAFIVDKELSGNQINYSVKGEKYIDSSESVSKK